MLPLRQQVRIRWLLMELLAPALETDAEYASKRLEPVGSKVFVGRRHSMLRPILETSVQEEDESISELAPSPRLCLRAKLKATTTA